MFARLAELPLRTLRQQGQGFAVQPIGTPIGRDQGAMAPDRAQLLATDALPDGPAGFDIGACEQQLAAFGLHLFGHRRLLPVDFATHPQQYAETDDQQ